MLFSSASAHPQPKLSPKPASLMLWSAVLIYIVVVGLLWSVLYPKSHHGADGRIGVESLVSQVRTIGDTFFIAANLHDSAHLFPRFADSLTGVAHALGPERVFISIYEDGSTDGTIELLEDLKKNLTQSGFQTSIRTGDTSLSLIPESEMGHIEKLAKLRNLALEPLYDYPETMETDADADEGESTSRAKSKSNPTAGGSAATSAWTKVIFLNDILFDIEDVLRLILTRDGKYDFVCGQDFYRGFYDRYVTRDARGDIPSMWYPYFADPKNQEDVRKWRATPVQSCWNGMIVFNAQIITEGGVRFRAASQDMGECEASECTLLCRDAVKHGFRRGLINPRVKVVYEEQYERWAKFILPQFRPILYALHRMSPRAGAAHTTDSGTSDHDHLCPSIPMQCC